MCCGPVKLETELIATGVTLDQASMERPDSEMKCAVCHREVLTAPNLYRRRIRVMLLQQYLHSNYLKSEIINR